MLEVDLSLNPELLAILACPGCHGKITPIDNEQGLLCTTCKVVYPVHENIPIMLIEESVPEDSWKKQYSNM